MRTGRAIWVPVAPKAPRPVSGVAPAPRAAAETPEMMRIFRHHEALPDPVRGSVVAVGNFDGLHRGHCAVIAEAGSRAARIGAPFAVLSFEPHPRRFFQPDAPPFRLTPFRVKARLLEAMGVDVLFALHFDRRMVAISPDDFIARVLVGGLGAREIVVGYDFVFGRARAGTVATLEQRRGALGYGLTAVAPVSADSGEVFSSTRVREYLRIGDVDRATLILGRFWEMEGRVETGDRIGRTIGFPTANLGLDPELVRPAYGVYAVRAGIDRGTETAWIDGIANFGRRPTVGGTEERFEVHLFNTDQDLYGAHMRVGIVGFLRGEMRFDGLDALKAQIAKDCARARRMLARRATPDDLSGLDEGDIVL